MDTRDDTRPGRAGGWPAGWLIWGAAFAVGAMASFWVGDALWRSLASLGALVLVMLGKLPRVAPSASSQTRTRLLLLLAVVCLAQATASDLWRFGTSPWVRVENVYPDYLGSKYFPELGYDDLQVATLVADAQGGDYWQRIATVWSPKRSARVSRASTTASYDPSLQFGPTRWRDFQHDVRALQEHRSPEAWSEIFHRRVEDASPLRIAVLRVLTQLPTDGWALKLLCSLDLLLLFLAFRQIGKTFGGRALAAALLLFLLAPVHGSGIVGGLLRYDGFCALALGVCGLRRNHPWAAAAFLAYAAGIRLFPAFLLISMTIPWARRFVAEGRWLPRDRRLALALLVMALAALGLSAWAGGGLDTWRRFATEIVEDHGSHRFEQAQLGLAHGFTRDIRNFDFTRPGRDGRRTLFEQQRVLYQAVSMLFLVLWGAAVWRRNRVDALLLGMVPFFVLWVASPRDWICLALLPLLARPGPAGRRRGRLLLASQLAMLSILGLAQLRGLSGFPLFGLFDVLLGLFWLLVLTTYLVSDLGVWRRRRPLRVVHRSRALVAMFFLGLFLLLCWLRLPDPEDPIRDVDEAVSALIATAWLDGGVPYRDAIDQRGPVTYLVYAIVFAVAGVYNMVAIQWALLLWVLACCVLVFVLGRSLRPGAEGVAMGYLAALFLAIGSVTFKRGQMLAFHTEWPMLLFATLAMVLVWRSLQRVAADRPEPEDSWTLVAAGVCFALGFLSKQPGIFDAGSAGLFVLLWRHSRGVLFHRGTLETAAWLATGFFGTLGLTVAYFGAHGALGDFVLYFWTYNVEHYTAVVPTVDRLASLDPFGHRNHYLTSNPLLLLGGLATVLSALGAWVRRKQVDGRLLVSLWFLAAYFGASYGGRNFGHYFVQILAPVSLSTAWALVDLWRRLSPEGSRFRGRADLALAGRGVLVAAVVVALTIPLVRFGDQIGWFQVWEERSPDDRLERLLEAVRQRTAPEDSIFVWGYYPEIYVLAPRRPASRYSNTNYLTGMLPWENHQPGVDTSEHIVEGAWAILVAELEANRPELVIDTSVARYRYYDKYPLADFAPLANLLARDFVFVKLLEDDRGRPIAALWQRR